MASRISRIKTMNDISYLECRVFVFKQVELEAQECFLHFDCDTNLNLFPSRVLTKTEHFELLNQD